MIRPPETLQYIDGEYTIVRRATGWRLIVRRVVGWLVIIALFVLAGVLVWIVGL